MSHHNHKACIATCIDCVEECHHCANSCLEEKDVKALAHCIRLDYECAAYCLVAINAMASKSAFAQQICAVCADICEACALECEKHLHIEHCKKCAEACRRCAKECRSMSTMKA